MILPIPKPGDDWVVWALKLTAILAQMQTELERRGIQLDGDATHVLHGDGTWS